MVTPNLFAKLIRWSMRYGCSHVPLLRDLRKISCIGDNGPPGLCELVRGADSLEKQTLMLSCSIILIEKPFVLMSMITLNLRAKSSCSRTRSVLILLYLIIERHFRWTEMFTANLCAKL